MYDYTISILEFLLTYLSWAYFLLICLQCAQFSHCASSFQNNNNNNNTALESSLDFWFQSIFLTQKYLDRSIPRILMPVQVVWRIELLVHHQEKSKQLKTIPRAHFLAHGWIKNSKHHQRIQPEQDYYTLITTTTTKVESMLDKLKETHAINAKAGRDNHV